MIPIKFPQADKTFVLDGSFDLPAYSKDGETITFWQYNKEEADDLVRKILSGEAVGVWIRQQGPVFPLSVETFNPFILPRQIIADVSITDNISLAFHDDDEIVLLTINPEEKHFAVEKEQSTDGDTLWVLYCDVEGYAGRHRTNYVFAEEVEVMNLASYYHGEYQYLLDACKKNPATTLILNRVNKTKRD